MTFALRSSLALISVLSTLCPHDGATKIVGDCATHELDHAKAVTPVPGGVGPMTIACLLSNTVTAAKRSAVA